MYSRVGNGKKLIFIFREIGIFESFLNRNLDF